MPLKFCFGMKMENNHYIKRKTKKRATHLAGTVNPIAIIGMHNKSITTTWKLPHNK